MKKLNEQDVNMYLDYCMNKGDPYEIAECFQELIPVCRFNAECKRRMKEYCDAAGIDFDTETGYVHVERKELMKTYLNYLQEYEEVDFFEHCIKNYGTTEERIKCLKIARSLCGGNIICQNRVDRYIDGLTNDFENGPYEIEEVADMMGLGMSSRNPPAETTEVELNDEEADKQQKKPLSWDISENYDIDAMGMAGRLPPMNTQEEELTDEEADKQGSKLTWSKQTISIEKTPNQEDKKLPWSLKEDYVPGELIEEVYLKLFEAGFKNYPKGWTRKSVLKFGKTIGKGYRGQKSMNPKAMGFFDRCVKRMKGKVANPEGFCASVKDVAHRSTGWRGKGKTPAQVKKSVRKPQFKIRGK